MRKLDLSTGQLAEPIRFLVSSLAEQTPGASLLGVLATGSWTCDLARMSRVCFLFLRRIHLALANGFCLPAPVADAVFVTACRFYRPITSWVLLLS